MPGQAMLTIGNKQWSVSLATTASELTQGLGGLSGIPPRSGMLFDMGAPQIIQVTTAPMLFPLDIAFLSESLVVTEVYRDIQPNYLVTSTLPARYFLEVNAGELDGIETGDGAAVSDVIVPAVMTSQATPDWMSAMTTFMEFAVMGVFMVGMVKTLAKGMFGPEEKKEVTIGGEKYQVMPGKSRALRELLPQILPSQGRTKGKFVIRMDRMGDIIVTHTGEPKRSVFLQFESDKDLVYDILRKAEREELDKGWNVEIADTEPRASILQELWENSALLPLTSQEIHRLGKSARGVIPKLPAESKGDAIFAQDIRDLVKMGQVISDEGATRMWESWKKHSGDWPSVSALPQTGAKDRKPARGDVSVGSWVERDRIGIWITDNRTDKTVAEWWDEDAAQMFEDGFFKPGRIHGETITGGEFEKSVLDYGEYIGILEKSGQKANYLPQTVETGDVIEIPLKDAPVWVQDAWKRLHQGSVPRVHIYRTNTARIDSPVFEYAVRDIVASKAGKTLSMYVPAYESLLASSPEEKALYFGGAVKLMPDEAIAVMDFWGDRFKSIDLYVHPAAYEPPKLVAPSLTSRQMKILATIRAYTSNYRREVFDTNVVTQSELDELQRLGLVDRRGALTVMGRNVVGREEPLSSYLPQTKDRNVDLRKDFDEVADVIGGELYRKGNTIQVWWEKWGKETWTCPDAASARSNFESMKERWNEKEEYLAHTRDKYVKVVTGGQTSMTIGSVVSIEEFQRENKKVRERGEQPATAQIWERGKTRLLTHTVRGGDDEQRVISEDLKKSVGEERLADSAYKERGGKAGSLGDRETHKLYEHIASEEHQHGQEFTQRLKLLADSPEFLIQTIEDIGYRDKIDNTFKAAIARARGTNDLTERITDGGDAGK